MKYKHLGRTDKLISEIGFGAWGIGGDKDGSISYGKTDDLVSMQALKTALEYGINFFDTSDFYGFGHSEQLIGSIINNQREKVIIATKGGMVSYTGEKNFEIEYISKSLEASLKRLKTDYVDIYQLHNPSVGSSNLDGLFLQLEHWKSKGIIRNIGVSVSNPSEAKFFIENYNIDSIQINFNLIDQRPIESGLWHLCEKNQIIVIARTPLCFGFLSGKIEDIDNFSEADHRCNWPKKQLEIWKNAPSLFDYLYKDFPEFSPAELALNFCLSYKAVTTVIPGILNPEEAKINARVSNMSKFSVDLLERLENTYKENSFFLKKN